MDEDIKIHRIIHRIDRKEREELRWLLRKSPEWRPHLDPTWYQKHDIFFCPGPYICYEHNQRR